MGYGGGGQFAGAPPAQTGMPRGPRGTVGKIGREAASASRQADSEEGLDWERLAVFGVGIAVGALLGVGVTLFTAPVSGRAARRAVRRGARHALWRGQDAWEDLRDELTTAALSRRKALRRRKRRAKEAIAEASYVRRRG